jgi:restriction system protein
LRQFQEFVDFFTGANDESQDEEAVGHASAPAVKTAAPANTTPEELIQSGYEQIQKALASDLLERVKVSSPPFFERLVVELLVKMGYGGSLADAGKAVGRSGDEGIDGIIKEDRLGLDVIYLQAKRWERTVGRPDIQQFAGALQGQRARKGVFISTSTFSSDAREYAARIDSRIILIDGVELSRLMIAHGIGVTPVAVYELKRVDSDYFDEE